MKVSKCCKSKAIYHSKRCFSNPYECQKCKKPCELIDQPESKEEDWEKTISSFVFINEAQKISCIDYIKQLLASQKRKLIEELKEEIKEKINEYSDNTDSGIVLTQGETEQFLDDILSIFDNKLKP